MMANIEQLPKTFCWRDNEEQIFLRLVPWRLVCDELNFGERVGFTRIDFKTVESVVASRYLNGVALVTNVFQETNRESVNRELD